MAADALGSRHGSPMSSLCCAPLRSARPGSQAPPDSSGKAGHRMHLEQTLNENCRDTRLKHHIPLNKPADPTGRACPPWRGRSGCRTTAHSECASSLPDHKDDPSARLRIERSDAVLSRSHGIGMRSRNLSRRVLLRGGPQMFSGSPSLTPTPSEVHVTMPQSQGLNQSIPR